MLITVSVFFFSTLILLLYIHENEIKRTTAYEKLSMDYNIDFVILKRLLFIIMINAMNDIET